MARKSSVAKDPRVREVVDRLIREGRHTIDEIVEHLERLGDDAPSRSAIGRYVKNANEQMARYRDAQEIAKVWVGKLEEEPEGDVGRLLSEMLRTVAFQQLASFGEGDVSVKDISFLAGAIRDLASADKVSTDRMLNIRKRVKEAAVVVEDIAKTAGLTEETILKFRSAVMGISV